jgi:L-seryl-tRNA(Ser) seleniumtransferase
MSDLRRQLPSIDALLAGPSVAELLTEHPRGLVVKAVRAAVDAARANGGTPPSEGWDAAVSAAVRRLAVPSLTPVINATGVVLHTNLGRAPLAQAAIKALLRVASGYAALEYDLDSGTRGSRHTHCRDLLVELTGSADAMVVNNAAAGLLLALSALSRGGETIVSRGELIEIGGSFRIPDIMARSGAKLVEVGTTNRTHPHDYERALTPDSKLLLKVHRSNFQVTGFTTEVAVAELAELAHARSLSCVYDLGSGLLVNLSEFGLTGEPTVPEGVAAGADLVVFSGDKLLGGPQAGILVGTEQAIGACRADPIARAVRADKLTLAALEATLALYRDRDTAIHEIPVLNMLTENEESIRARAERLGGELIEGDSEVGGGSFPGTKLRTWLAGFPDQSLAERLRRYDPPIISRVAGNRVLLDARTILPGQVETVIAAVHADR